MSNKERLFPIGILEKSKSNELIPNFEKGEFYLADYLNKKLPKVILIGKPNVGKSSLLNTIIGRKEAIVGDEIGLTRDYQEVKYTLDNSQITISDTAGISFNNKNFNKLSYNKTLEKIKISDLIFFLIDSSNELTNDDYSCAE